MSLKIGVDASCWTNQRGFGRYTRELLAALLELDRTNEYSFVIDAASYEVATLPARARPIVVRTSAAAATAAAADSARSPADILRMTRATRGGFDLFFYPAVYSYFPMLPGPKCVVTFHDVIADRRPELTFPDRRARLFWTAKSWLARRQADAILTVSEHAKAAVVAHWGVAPSRIRAVLEAPSPVFTLCDDRPQRAALLGRWSMTPDTPYLIYVGGISPHKNLELLVSTFCRLLDEPQFSKTRLLLVGGYSNDVFFSSQPAISKLIGDRGVRDRVIFTGYVPDDDLVHLYNGAIALVFPSLDEGFGLPAVEAMACGLPVVLSNAGSLPEVGGEAGLYFDPRNGEAMLAALRQVVALPRLREELSRRSLARAADFSWQKTAAGVLALFSEVTSR
jgi:glycosyltransferase involved in cell wall biosynthesis